MEENASCISYCVDGSDRITAVGEGWDVFATAARSSHLATPLVVGEPLFRFVSNPDTQYVYRLLMNQVRTSSRPVHFPFRCDAPDRRRFMRMTISPVGDNRLRFDSCVLREESRPPVALLDPSVPRSSELLIICGWCKRVMLPEDEQWVEVEEAVEQLGLFDATRLPILSHTMCPACHAAMHPGL